MPPGQDKLPDAKLTIIRQWIEGGLLENTGSSAKAKKPSVRLAAPTTTGRPAGPIAMPEGVSCEPAVVTPRAAAVSALATSPWAPLIAVAGQQQIALYHSDDARLLGILRFPEGVPYSLRFSGDGSVLLAGGGRGASTGLAALYDVKTGNRLVTVGDELDVVLAADISHDLKRIALGGPGASSASSRRKRASCCTKSANTPIGSMLCASALTACCWPRQIGRTDCLCGKPRQRANTSICADTPVRSRMWLGARMPMSWPVVRSTARATVGDERRQGNREGQCAWWRCKRRGLRPRRPTRIGGSGPHRQALGCRDSRR